MLRTVCKSKIHRATVTDANVQYMGSLTVDAELMKAADLVPYEQVHVVDVNNGARLVTYCIEGAPGSGTICANGAAARLISPGDKVIIISYAQLSPSELERFEPRIVLLDERNRIRQVTTAASQLSEELGTIGRASPT
jgi:aspartate 1-decarboxylase